MTDGQGSVQGGKQRVRPEGEQPEPLPGLSRQTASSWSSSGKPSDLRLRFRNSISLQIAGGGYRECFELLFSCCVKWKIDRKCLAGEKQKSQSPSEVLESDAIGISDLSAHDLSSFWKLSELGGGRHRMSLNFNALKTVPINLQAWV